MSRVKKLPAQLSDQKTPNLKVNLSADGYSVIAVVLPSLLLFQVQILCRLYCRFPLEQAPEAFKALLSRQVIGKVLLTPDTGAQSRL